MSKTDLGGRVAKQHWYVEPHLNFTSFSYCQERASFETQVQEQYVSAPAL